MKKRFCVVYLVDGFHYRYRCYANNYKIAKFYACEYMGIDINDIVEIYEE